MVRPHFRTSEVNHKMVAEHLWPPSGVKYVGNGKPRGPQKKGVSPIS